jgi:DNA-binding NtrC family response regulator
MKMSMSSKSVRRIGVAKVHSLPDQRGLALRPSLERLFDSSRNPAMQEIVETIRRVAATHVNVLLIGESGTGKEWAAHKIHRTSPRAACRLVTVDCSALTPEELEREVFGYESVHWREVDIKQGAMERANEGTLLLHEMGTVPPALLFRMLRAIEFQSLRRIAGVDDVTLNVRLIATMTQPAGDGRAQTQFPDGLLYRLSPIILELLPLRRRREDLPMLIEVFLEDVEVRPGRLPMHFSPEAIRACREFDWPGNLRHLRNAVEYAAVMCGGDAILPEHLPPYLLDESGRKG